MKREMLAGKYYQIMGLISCSMLALFSHIQNVLLCEPMRHVMMTS